MCVDMSDPAMWFTHFARQHILVSLSFAALRTTENFECLHPIRMMIMIMLVNGDDGNGHVVVGGSQRLLHTNEAGRAANEHHTRQAQRQRLMRVYAARARRRGVAARRTLSTGKRERGGGRDA